MSVETWGMLEKSQEDPEKIEEAIARLIAAHNDNEESHIGEGRSLDQHKVSEIIDHLKGSIIADKLTATKFLMLSNFESLDGFDIDSGDVIASWPGVRLRHNGTSDPDVLFFEKAAFPNNRIDFTKNPFLQFVANSPNIGGIDSSIVYGLFEESPVTFGFGLRIVDSKFYLVFKTDIDAGEVEITEISISNGAVFRFEVDSENNKILVYVDGVLKLEEEFSVGASPFEISTFAGFLTNTSGAARYLQVSNLVMGRDA